MKKIVIINGHPDRESYNYALQEKYKQGAIKMKSEVREINLCELKFDPNLSAGYSNRQQLEADLVRAQEDLKWADHIVWVYPLWWGMMPALLKAFLDRVLLPGFAFKYHSSGIRWDKLLQGRTSEIICTIDYPVWYFKFFLKEGGVRVMRKMVLAFCGLKTTRTTYIGPVKPSTLHQRENWLKKLETLGATT